MAIVRVETGTTSSSEVILVQ